MNELKQMFLDQSPRDQLFLSLGGVLVVAFILFFMVLFPMQDELEKQQRRNAGLMAEQSEVLDMAGQLMALRQPGASAGGAQSLNAIVNTTTREHNLRVENLQPTGNAIRVRLGASSFNDVIAWLHDMEVKRGLQVKDISITANTSPGTVVVQLQLVQGG